MKKLVILFLALINYVFLFAADGINNQLSCNIYWNGTMSYSSWSGYNKGFNVEVKNHSAKTIVITNVILYLEGRNLGGIGDINGELLGGEQKSFSLGISNRAAEPQVLPTCEVHYSLDGVEYVKKSDDGISTFNLSSYNIELYIGQTHQLSVDYNGSVVWSSDNEQIATIDSKGLVQGISEGMTVVHVTSSDGTFMASCTVSVVDNNTGFLLQSNAEMFVDETTKLSYTILDEKIDIKKVSWKSSDENVVTVNSEGVVSAKTSGQAIISAIHEQKEIGVCAITVKKRPLTIKAKDMQRYYGDENPAFAFDVSGYAGTQSDLIGSLSYPTVECDAEINSNVGEYSINLVGGRLWGAISDKYELKLVPGVLTVKKAKLVASAGSYFKHPGDDNPPFAIKYSGFKCEDTKDVIIKEPKIECSADKNSPYGAYDVTISGGEAQNYEFEYVNGKLYVGELSLTITTSGEGSIMFNGQSIQGKEVFSVGYGQDIDLTFIPNEGYKLSFAMVNATDITKNLINGQYTIKGIKEDMIVVATFVESNGSFTIDGINYNIVSAPSKTVSISSGSYRGHISIPATVKYEGQTWNVIGLSDFCFYNNKELISIDLPNSLQKDRIGQGLFNNCIGLAAITWNSNFQMTDDMLGAVSNKNLLFYANDLSYAPASVKNVVVNGTAKEIVLSDAESGNNFYCPTTFTAEKISYTHRFGMESGYSSQAKGWETIALPFAVSEITHESKGKLLPFGKWNSSSSEKPFWLCNLSSNGFTRATSIQANTPYIICMPNNANEYDEEYCISGNVTFSATNVKVSVSNSVTTAKSNGKTFVPAFCAQEKASGVYALNVNNSYHSEAGGYTEGSAFVSDLRAVSPFEAYMTTDASNAKRAFLIEFSETTGIDEMPSVDNKDGLHKVFNLNGQLVKKAKSQRELDETLKELPTGVYVINGKKTVIKR